MEKHILTLSIGPKKGNDIHRLPIYSGVQAENVIWGRDINREDDVKDGGDYKVHDDQGTNRVKVDDDDDHVRDDVDEDNR